MLTNCRTISTNVDRTSTTMLLRTSICEILYKMIRAPPVCCLHLPVYMSGGCLPYTVKREMGDNF